MQQHFGEAAFSFPFRLRLIATLLITGAVITNGPLAADTFTVVADSGKEFDIEGRLAGSGQDLHAIERDDGRLTLVPESRVRKRVVNTKPTPITAAALSQRLESQFPKGRALTYINKPIVVCYITASPIENDRDALKKRGTMQRVSNYLKNVQGIFLKFVQTTRVPIKPARYPLVALVFESDTDFNAYVRATIRNKGLTAGRIAGFYSTLSNRLVLRESECETFEVPLHEAIHQLVYNRQILNRLAPIPVWFHEGLATAFEGDGLRVRHGPGTLHKKYVGMALRAQRVDWAEIVRNDRAFRGDILAGEAYGHAWALHWLLVTNYRTQYARYLRLLSQKKTLDTETPDERLKEFEQIVGKSIGELQREFYVAIRKLRGIRSVSQRESPVEESASSVACILCRTRQIASILPHFPSEYAWRNKPCFVDNGANNSANAVA